MYNIYALRCFIFYICCLGFMSFELHFIFEETKQLLLLLLGSSIKCIFMRCLQFNYFRLQQNKCLQAIIFGKCWFFFGRKCDQHIKMKLFLGFHNFGLFEILHSKFSKQFVNFWMKSGFMNDFCKMNNLLPRNSQKIRATVCRENNLVGLESL